MQSNTSQPKQDGWKGAKPWPEIAASLVVIGVGILGYVIWYRLSMTSVLLANVVTLIELASIGILAVRFQGWLHIVWWIWWRNRLYTGCTRANGVPIAESPPRLRRATRVSSGCWELDVQLRNGVTQADLERISDSLKSSFKATRVTIHRGDRGDRAVIEVQKKSFFRNSRSTGLQKRLRETASREIRSIPIGIDESGREVSVPLRAGGVVVGGLPGSGKSNFVHLLVAHFARLDGAKIYLVDPKRVELSGWRHRATRFGVGQDDAISILDEVIGVMTERYQELEQRGERGSRSDMPPMLVVFEEVTALIAGPRAKAIEERLRQVMALGRAAGIMVVLVAQRPGVDTLAGSLRDLAETRIAFRTSTSDMSDTILGRGSATSGFDASKITADMRGVGYLSTGEREPTYMRCHLVDDTTLQELQRSSLPPEMGEED